MKRGLGRQETRLLAYLQMRKQQAVRKLLVQELRRPVKPSRLEVVAAT